MILAKLTFKLAYIVVFLDITKQLLLPQLSLLIWICVLMVADFITGIIKAKLLKEPITSEKARGSIIKFLQYFGCIGIVVVLINQNIKNEAAVKAMEWARDGVAILIIYIECLSVFENLYAMDKKTTLAIYVIQPIYWILSFAVRNNPFKRAQDEAQKKQKEKQPPDAD